MRHLATYTFNRLPTGRDRYSDLLPGLTVNPDTEEIECWQTQKNKMPELLPAEDIVFVQSVVLDGVIESPMIEPIAPFIDMLLYGWETQMQALGMVAIPPLFIKITQPVPACEANGWMSDEEYGNEFLASWGNQTKMILRPNMELVEYKFESTLNLEILDALYYTIVDYLNPASFINREGNLIGGSTTGQLELMASFISGIQTEICSVIDQLIQPYFVYNSYPEGYRVVSKLKPLNTTNREADRADAKLMIENRFGDPNVALQKLEGCEGVDDKTWKEFSDRWSLIPVVQNTSTQEKAVSANLAKEDLPDEVVKIKTPDELGDGMEAKLSQLIDQAEKDIIKAVRG